MILCVVCFDLLCVCVCWKDSIMGVLDGIVRNARSIGGRKLHVRFYEYI